MINSLLFRFLITKIIIATKKAKGKNFGATPKIFNIENLKYVLSE